MRRTWRSSARSWSASAHCWSCWASSLWLVPQVPWIGRLPGDIRIERPGFSLYLPLGTCLLLSLVLSLLAWLVQRLR